jgi:hypothetical protein
LYNDKKAIVLAEDAMLKYIHLTMVRERGVGGDATTRKKGKDIHNKNTGNVG